jgi:transcriptional regulator with XRE-family HTH domain
LVIRTKRPRTKYHISVPLTFADHIRKKRLEMRLTYPELAKLLCISETSIWGWETGKSMPLVSVYPSIISFLGYAPFQTENLTFGEQLSTARHIAGITRKELAQTLRMGTENYTRN